MIFRIVFKIMRFITFYLIRLELELHAFPYKNRKLLSITLTAFFGASESTLKCQLGFRVRVATVFHYFPKNLPCPI